MVAFRTMLRAVFGTWAYLAGAVMELWDMPGTIPLCPVVTCAAVTKKKLLL